jgi:hypothetical protein
MNMPIKMKINVASRKLRIQRVWFIGRPLNLQVPVAHVNTNSIFVLGTPKNRNVVS